jgi:phosphopantothenoylcysteine decarboxylase/phosphopantothenate--cysteine ligase
MHASMYAHEIVSDNIKKLKRLGVVFVGPKMEESKAKMASQDDIVRAVLRALGPGDLKKNKVLIITGPTKEQIDDVRCITNFSSGRTGVEIALEAHRRGAKVELWAGDGVSVPEFLDCKRFSGAESLVKMATKTKADIILVPAAISDFTVRKETGKIPSSKPASLSLKPAKKVIGILRKNNKGKIIGFKAEVGISQAGLEKKARGRMKEFDLDLIVANLLEKVEGDKTEAPKVS